MGYQDVGKWDAVHRARVAILLTLLFISAVPASALTPPPRELTVVLDVCTIDGSDVVPQEANIEVWVDYDNDGEKDSGELAGCTGTNAMFMAREGNRVSYSVSANGFLPYFDSFTAIDFDYDFEIYVTTVLRPCVAPTFELYMYGCYSQSELLLKIDTSDRFGIDSTALVAQDGYYSEPLFAICSPTGSVLFHAADAYHLGLNYDVFVYELERLDSPTAFRWGFDALRENITLYALIIEGTVIPPEGLEAMLTVDSQPQGLSPMNVTLDGENYWVFCPDYYVPCTSIPSIHTWPPYPQTLNPPTTSPLTPPVADPSFLEFLSRALLVLAGAVAGCTFIYIGLFAGHSSRRHCHVWHERSVDNEVYHICEICGRTEKRVVSWRRMERNELADLARTMLQRED